MKIREYHLPFSAWFAFLSSFFLIFKLSCIRFIISSSMILMDSDYAITVSISLCNLALFSIAFVLGYRFWLCCLSWALNLASISRSALILLACSCLIRFKYCLTCPSTISYLFSIACSSATWLDDINFWSMSSNCLYFSLIWLVSISSAASILLFVLRIGAR